MTLEEFEPEPQRLSIQGGTGFLTGCSLITICSKLIQ